VTGDKEPKKKFKT
jgi:transposase InsO family protein